VRLKTRIEDVAEGDQHHDDRAAGKRHGHDVRPEKHAVEFARVQSGPIARHHIEEIGSDRVLEGKLASLADISASFWEVCISLSGHARRPHRRPLGAIIDRVVKLE
jgi:hypothetical protein